MVPSCCTVRSSFSAISAPICGGEGVAADVDDCAFEGAFLRGAGAGLAAAPKPAGLLGLVFNGREPALREEAFLHTRVRVDERASAGVLRLGSWDSGVTVEREGKAEHV
eukprot:2510970-Rhodomonas_salina.1